MRGDIEVGARLPDYELPDQDGVMRRLSDLQGSNPMVLHLSRGGFDPKEHRFLRHLVDAELDFRVGYTRVALISTDNQLKINEFRDSVGARFPFLSDPQRSVRRDLDIVEYTDPVHDPMVPHTFVLAPGLEISAIYNGYWYWGRPTVEELHRDLREVMRNLRPDFDLGAPGLREAWDRGEREQFLVSPVEGEAIRYTEGAEVGVKRSGTASSKSYGTSAFTSSRCWSRGRAPVAEASAGADLRSVGAERLTAAAPVAGWGMKPSGRSRTPVAMEGTRLGRFDGLDSLGMRPGRRARCRPVRGPERNDRGGRLAPGPRRAPRASAGSCRSWSGYRPTTGAFCAST